MPFRFCSAQVFLTYPQCTLSKEDVLDHFEGKWGIKSYMVSKEEHANGGFHIHAYFRFNRKLDLSSERCFDINEFHPNIVANIRSPKKVLEYVKKDGDYIASDDIDKIIKDGDKENWGSIRLKSTNKRDYMEMVAANFPRDHALNYEKLEYYAEKVFGEIRSTYVSPPGYLFPHLITTMAEWATEYVLGPQLNATRAKTLFLVGPTRTGKSAWARSIGTHMYFQGMFNLDDWDNNARYAVFDDIEWKYMPNKKQFIGCQSNFVVTDRYRKKRTVDYGLPTIICMNHDNYQAVQADPMYDWVLGNSVVVIVNNKLF